MSPCLSKSDDPLDELLASVHSLRERAHMLDRSNLWFETDSHTRARRNDLSLLKQCLEDLYDCGSLQGLTLPECLEVVDCLVNSLKLVGRFTTPQNIGPLTVYDMAAAIWRLGWSRMAEERIYICGGGPRAAAAELFNRSSRNYHCLNNRYRYILTSDVTQDKLVHIGQTSCPELKLLIENALKDGDSDTIESALCLWHTFNKRYS